MKKHFPLILFAAVAIAGLVVARLAYVTTEDATRIKFEAAADEALNRIDSRIELHLGLLRAAHAFFAVRPGEVSREEFGAFFGALNVEKNYGGLLGLGLMEVGRAAERAELERDIAAYHGEEAGIHPPSDAEWVAPIVIYEPLGATNRSAIGYDMYTDPPRRDAIRTAWETVEPRASGRVAFDTLGVGEPGALVFLRLDPGADGPMALGRRGGLVFAALRVGDLFHASLDRLPVLPVHVSVFDGSPAPANLIYRSDAAPDPSFSGSFPVSRPLSVAGRLWTIEFRPTGAFVKPSSPAVPVMLGLAGLLLAGAVALIARYQARALRAVAEMHESAEQSLLEKDLMLQEMKHRIKNSIARVLAMARQTASRSSDLDEFTASFGARLQAMAASQDILTRSRWQRADLAELLRVELGQVFGKELPDGILEGPQVLLPEATTQALGLTFHELATNALKYGQAGTSPETLKVKWRLEGGGILRLSWVEAGGRDVTPPVKPGFGTRLIDVNVTRELGGTIVRDYRPHGLEIEITVPLEPDGISRQPDRAAAAAQPVRA